MRIKEYKISSNEFSVFKKEYKRFFISLEFSEKFLFIILVIIL